MQSTFVPCPLSSEVDYSITELGNVVKRERIKAENQEGKSMCKNLLFLVLGSVAPRLTTAQQMKADINVMTSYMKTNMSMLFAKS